MVIANKTLQNCVKQGSVYFLLCPKQGLKIEDGVLHRVYILGLFCPKQGQGLKPSAAPLYPTMGQVLPPALPGVASHDCHETFIYKSRELKGLFDGVREIKDICRLISKLQAFLSK